MIRLSAPGLALALWLGMTPQVSLAANEPDDVDGGFSDVVEGYAGIEDGVIQADVTATAGSTIGRASEATSQTAPAPDGSWIRVTAIDYFASPPCVTTSSIFLDGVDDADADRIERDRENQFVAEFEAYMSGGTPPPAPCPSPDPTPGLVATEAIEFADSARELLPHADPSISGSYAITGLRSWLDLGRPSEFRAEAELDLGPFTRTGAMTATATTVVEWGDGTVTTHTSAGGGYREDGPGPDDITHTYVDASPSNVLTVVDTWEITVTVPGLDPIDLVWTAPARTLTFPIREVRSVRDR